MFQDHFTIVGIVGDPEKLEAHIGGHLYVKRIGDVESVEESDMLMLIMQAGVAAATIYVRTPAWVHQNREFFPGNPSWMHYAGNEGDFELIMPRKVRLAREFSIDKETVLWNGFQNIYEYLLEPVVWQAVLVIASALNTATDLQLTGTQVSQILTEKYNLTSLDAIRDRFRVKRYPLTAERLSDIDFF